MLTFWVGVVVGLVLVVFTTLAMYQRKHAAPTDIRVAEIVVYPVKSAAGVSVKTCVLDSQSGLALDRLWTVVDGRGAFMSQRRAPKLALIQPSLPESRKQPLKLSAPGMESIEVPQLEGGASGVVRIWTDQVEAVDQGDEVAAWLQKYLDVPGLRLVRMPPSTSRWCEKEFAPLLGTRAAFSDAYPILLASTASLEDLNAKMPSPLPMNRFRPNIVIQGCAPWLEDSWLSSRVRIGAHTFYVCKPCARCKMPTICQETGVAGGDAKATPDDDADDLGGGPKAGAEPTATLMTFRTGAHLGYDLPAWQDEVFFGQNICHLPTLLDRLGLKDTPTLAVGDAVAPA